MKFAVFVDMINCCGKMWSVVFLLMCCAYIEVQCANATDKTTLNAALLSGYNPSVHPGSDYSTQLLHINTSFTFVSIQSFDEVASEFVIMGYFGIYWSDARLAWDPASYNGLNETHVKQKEIWTPSFILADSASGMDILGDDDMPVVVSYTGEVIWSPPTLAASSCNADVTYYPFDLQTCELKYKPWGYASTDIQLNAISSTLSLFLYSENPTWELINTQFVAVQSGGLFYRMTIQFKRRYSFFIVNIILPIVFMCFTNMFVFLIPVESGDRLGFSTTLLLTIAVFLSIVTDALPQSSTPSIPIICYLLIIHILLSMLIMFSTIFGVRLYLKPEEEPVPNWAAKLTRFVHVITCKRRNKVAVDSDNTVSATTKGKGAGNSMEDDVSSVNTLDDVMSWTTVGKAFDKIFLGCFMMAAMASNLAILFILSSN